MDINLVVAEVAASLDGPVTRPSERSYGERLVTGTRDGQKIDVRCEHIPTGRGPADDWDVVAEVDGCPPLVLHLNRRGPNDAEAAARGDIVIVPTGDAAFDEAWTIEGAPRAIVARVFGPSVRDAVAKLAATRIILSASDATSSEGVLSVAAGKVKISSNHGAFDAAVLLRAIDLTVAVCKEIAGVVDERRRSPPGSTVLAAEELELKTVQALVPEYMETRVWRRMSRRTRAILFVCAVLVAICTVVGLLQDAASFIH